MVMNMQRTIIALALAGCAGRDGVAGVRAGAEQVPPPRLKWSFAGPFGKYDEAQLQRGFKIYRRSAPTAIRWSMLSFRNLADAGGPGFSRGAGRGGGGRIQDQGHRRQGQSDRARRPAGRSFPGAVRERAGRARRPMALAPPDMSTLAKARSYSAASPGSCSTCSRSTRSRGRTTSPRYVKGYEDAPKGFTLPPGGHYNEYFPGHNIAMPPPLQAGPGDLRRRRRRRPSSNIPRTSRPS